MRCQEVQLERSQREKRLVQEAKDAAEREWRSKLALMEEQADAARADAAAAAALAAADRDRFTAYGGGGGGGDSALYAAAKMQAGQVRRPLSRDGSACVGACVECMRARLHRESMPPSSLSPHLLVGARGSAGQG
jgi:hypothetical protein